jgi:hypothetical protein
MALAARRRRPRRSLLSAAIFEIVNNDQRIKIISQPAIFPYLDKCPTYLYLLGSWRSGGTPKGDDGIDLTLLAHLL